MAIVTSRGFIDAGSLGRLPTKEGATVNMGNLKRTPVLGDEGPLGYTEEWEAAPSMKVTLVDTTEVDKKKIAKLAGETIVLTTNNGQQFTLTNAYTSNVLELNVKDGTLEVEFFGSEML